MTSRSGRGRWLRVLEARKQARADIGHDPAGGDLYGAPKARTRIPDQPPMPTAVLWKFGDGVGVLTLGEAATKLGVTRTQLESMIDAGKIKALPTGYTRTIPTSEIERLRGPISE